MRSELKTEMPKDLTLIVLNVRVDERNKKVQDFVEAKELTAGRQDFRSEARMRGIIDPSPAKGQLIHP
jgi:hypothetical protein